MRPPIYSNYAVASLLLRDKPVFITFKYRFIY